MEGFGGQLRRKGQLENQTIDINEIGIKEVE
jgi:hypothetical protein